MLITHPLILKIAQFYYSNEKDRNKSRRYIHFDDNALRTKINIAIKNAKHKSNIALGHRFINSNIFSKAGNEITVTATAIRKNNPTIKTAAIFENLCQKLAENIANI